MKTLLFVGLGGALGAMARYALSLLPLREGFPLNTLLINVAGAVVIGAVAGAAMRLPSASSNLVAFLKTGLCGGFTTFSTFSLEALSLMENGRIGAAALYALASVLLCLAGVWAGKSGAALILSQLSPS